MAEARASNPHLTLRRRFRRAGGFTLIEAALTTVIIGTGVLAMVAAQQAYHMQNDWAHRSGTAMLLANEIRELTITLPLYDPIYGVSGIDIRDAPEQASDIRSVADFYNSGDGLVMGEDGDIAHPINGRPSEITSLTRWRQIVRVHNLDDDAINVDEDSPAVPLIGSTNLMRVIVDVQYRDPNQEAYETITTLTWIVTR